MNPTVCLTKSHLPYWASQAIHCTVSEYRQVHEKLRTSSQVLERDRFCLLCFCVVLSAVEVYCCWCQWCRPFKKPMVTELAYRRPDFNRTQSRVVTGLLTGHNTLRRHFHLMGLINSPLHRRRGAEEETSACTLCALVWVPGHRGVFGNEEAEYKLAREASASPLLGPEPALGIPGCLTREAIKNWTEYQHHTAWRDLPGHRHGKFS
jgi:hypothetical protein